MMGLADKPEVRWASLRDGKLDWAYRAYRRFIEDLSEDVRAHLMGGAGDQEPYVVVFGKTQVGKTTLLLELMGLGPAAQARVSRVLRGGREFGKSATATTMEYRRSPDGDWHLDDGSGMRRIASDDGICEALGELRQRMSKRRLKVEKPVVVWIPDDCFGQTAGTGIGTRMLDLPGDNPADEVEREHVERMAQRYVPHADLILLVGRGDDLSFLNPEALTLPSIEDWQYVPNRFRIVTTYSFTPHTVQQFARNHEGKLTAEHFRERLLEQIRTFGLPLSPEAASSARFFPLEFGQSWQTMLQEDAAFAKRVAPLVNELKATLHADIQASATETARFRNALDVQVVTRRKRKARIEQGKAALAGLAERIAKAEATEKQALDAEPRTACQAKAARTLLSRRAAAEQELSTDLVFDAEDHIAKVDDLTTNTSALFGRITDVTSWLRQCFLDTAPSGSEARKFFGKSRPNLTANIGKVKRIANDEFAILIARMEGYSLDEYYPKLSKCFSDDKTRLKADIRDASVKTAELLQTLWRKHADKRAAELEAEAAAAENEGLGLKQIAAQQKKAREKLTARSSEVEADMTRALARLDSDEATALRFSNMLDEEYLAELRQKHAQVAMAKHPVDALLTLLSVADLSEERRKIKLS